MSACWTGKRPSALGDGDYSSCAKAGALLPYSITSSARASNAGGTVSPSAYAVLGLITKPNFVGCSTSRNEQACSNFL